AARSLRALWHLANGIQANPAASEPPACLWEDYLRHLPEIAAHAHRWTTAQMKQPDLASNLVARVLRL
ncbi:MAG: elongation factor P maturation arginine rhamnosyltransferase EarP, partial [Rhodocyclaceae bacterium]|nr:elongation factor P maturation arginine rhamnosyltransferase EarP [Rhodocyclaceae bacterium]